MKNGKTTTTMAGAALRGPRDLGNPPPFTATLAPSEHPGIAGDATDAQSRDGADVLDGATAFGFWLLLERPAPNDEKSKGGIILPDAVREKPAWIVRAIGEKVTIPVKIGDHVAFDGTRIMKDAKSGRAWAYAMEGQLMGALNPERLRHRIITQTAGI